MKWDLICILDNTKDFCLQWTVSKTEMQSSSESRLLLSSVHPHLQGAAESAAGVRPNTQQTLHGTLAQPTGCLRRKLCWSEHVSHLLSWKRESKPDLKPGLYTHAWAGLVFQGLCSSEHKNSSNSQQILISWVNWLYLRFYKKKKTQPTACSEPAERAMELNSAVS